MKYIAPILAVLLVLCGCTGTEKGMEQALQLRQNLISSNGCQFETAIVVDYLSHAYTFSMKCEMDAVGNVSFSVLLPESISGITGTVSASEGKLTFDDQVLLFAPLAEGQITPVSAPWFILNALRSGYIKGCSQDGTGLTLYINDSYAEGAIQVNIQTVNGSPIRAEIVYNHRVLVTMDVEKFCLL